MALPPRMRCIENDSASAQSRLSVGSRPMPVPGPGQVVIAVAAAGINRPDLLQRVGAYPPPPGASDLLGLEVAGRIAALGEGCGALSLGDAVCALVSGGGYADHCLAEAALCLPVPQGFSFVQAAALPEGFFTVWHNVFQRGRLREGEKFLVHGGASGIGTAAIQLAKAFGAITYATAGGSEKCRRCEKLGADRAIDYRAEDFVAIIAALTEKRGVDLVLDMVGGDYLERNLKCLAMDGRHVSIAFLRGPEVALNLLPVMVKRLTLTGSTLRPQSVAAKAAMAAELRAKVWPLLDAGRIIPQIHKVFPFEAVEEAHAALQAGDHFGKIILTLPES